ncbi:hypothetical protein JTB14_031959 [Gonioctena quinquepunctata]|nr:hypothetical protein JTB14_031959 [Gonioctena quinquepunctata]
MDDSLISVDTKHEALEIYDEITKILNGANLPLRKWCSNEKAILNSILGNQGNEDKLIQYHDNEELKTLGIAWNPKSDTLSYAVNINVDDKALTKRSVLATISRISDPLGLIGTATIQSKLFMRKLWPREISWDESLPADMVKEWTHF